MCALIVFEIEVGSTSTCTIVALGQNFLTLFVTRSSKRAPSANITSALAIALLASSVPCMPSIPTKFGCTPDIPPSPISVFVMGAFNDSTKCVNCSDVFEITIPPPE